MSEAEDTKVVTDFPVSAVQRFKNLVTIQAGDLAVHVQQSEIGALINRLAILAGENIKAIVNRDGPLTSKIARIERDLGNTPYFAGTTDNKKILFMNLKSAMVRKTGMSYAEISTLYG